MQACTLLLILLLGLSKIERTSTTKPKLTNETEMFDHCFRKCNGKARICYYKLHIERYVVLGGACGQCSSGVEEDCKHPQCVTANGLNKGILTVNRQLPSPIIQVCKGDRIIADVINRISGTTVTIHWNGLLQKGYQYYDGVPFVNQCPILPGTTFRYNFVVNQSGTFSYHSHSGLQKVDGIGGALIVRDVSDSQSNLYDYDLPDHVLYITDWFLKPAVDYIPGYSEDKIKQIPITYLVNGRGAHEGGQNASFKLPLAEFSVEAGIKYRFRLISGLGSECGVHVVFEGHKVLVISADGNLKFKPMLVDTVTLNAGDRFDVVLHANRKIDKYFIFFENVDQDFCTEMAVKEKRHGIRQVAILKYVGSKDKLLWPIPPRPNLGIEFNALLSKCHPKNSSKICISHLEGESNAPALDDHCFSTMSVAYHYYVYKMDSVEVPGRFLFYSEPKYLSFRRPLINNITHKPAPSNILTQINEIPREHLCNYEECIVTPLDIRDPREKIYEKICLCTNIIHFAYEIIVNMVLFEHTGGLYYMSHSIHIHGHQVYILDQGPLPLLAEERKQRVRELEDQLRSDKIDLKNKPLRDTITIPPNGYTLIRFYTDNPGAWLFSNNLVFSADQGMTFVIRIGDESMLPPVPKNFPRCGSSMPDY